jgi:hypothetical protein
MESLKREGIDGLERTERGRRKITLRARGYLYAAVLGLK